MKTLKKTLVYLTLALVPMLFSNFKENIHLKTNHMKKFFSIITILFLLGLPVKAQWKQSYLWPSSEIQLMSLVDDNILWVKDSYGSKISITNDGGNTWTTKDLPPFFLTATTAGGITAVNGTTAFQIISQGTDIGIYKTTDAGTTWNKQTSGFNSTISFPDFIYFWNENDGVAVGDGNSELKYEIYTTTDGGTTWNSVAAASMPSGLSNFSFNTNTAFKVHGNTIYFITNEGKIMKSINKGINWTEINTPLTTLNGASFDFKDDLNGILTNSTTGQIYSTSDAGNTWSQISTSSLVGNLKYSPANNAYLSANYYTGYSYSTDNGLTWIQNQTFNKIGLGMIDATSTGKVFICGLGSVFSSDNYKNENIAVKKVALTGTNSIDVSYSNEPYLLNSTDSTNYQLSAIRLGKETKVLIKTISQDAADKSLMHLTLNANLPSDSVRLIIKNIYGLNGTAKGNPMLYNEPGVTTYFKNYSSSKTINATTPGTLWSSFSAIDKARISQLTVTGTIDARDFRIIRDSLTAVNTLDISATTIAAYTGTEGTISTASNTYNANEIPRLALYNKKGLGLTSIILPTSTLSIARSALNTMPFITSIVIPSGVTAIGQFALLGCSQLKNLSIPKTVTSIGLGAFTNCVSLATIHVYGSTPLALPVISNSTNDAFYAVPTSTCTLYVPTGSTPLYNSANQWSNFSKVVEFDASLNHDYSTAKFALIGSSYFLDNVLGGTKALWNSCWKDSKNNIQPSVPVVTGNGLIYTWNFPGVYLDGANQGMFRFCTPNADNTTPNWSISPIGSVEITKYTGNAATDVDRTTDANGAFIILTAGAIKQYDLQLIIDQTSGKDVFTLNTNYSDATGVQLINESNTIVQYNVYSIVGRLVSSGTSDNGLTIQNVKQKLANGIYIIRAKLSNGQIKNLKVQIK
jgi:photosystem II stability/assembly factor-like uncharacterized protein